jgi:hypothetical protein
MEVLLEEVDRTGNGPEIQLDYVKITATAKLWLYRNNEHAHFLQEEKYILLKSMVHRL